jgi:hypothetical protein
VNAQKSIFGRPDEFKTLNSWGAKKIQECVRDTTDQCSTDYSMAERELEHPAFQVANRL